MTALESIGQSGVEVQAFVDGRSSLLLSTLTPQGDSFASCTPFVSLNGEIYVAFSELQIHAVNLRLSGFASVLILGDSRNGGRRRLSYSVRSTLVEPDRDEWQQVMPLLAAAGRGLKLFRLSPQGQHSHDSDTAKTGTKTQASALH